jgi:hypothetical protein
VKLKYKEIATERSQRLEQQEYHCSLCGDTIIDDAVLDHDHKTGRIRSVLHRGCNAMLGKIENNMPRNRMTMHRLERFCSNIVKYITQEYEDIIHPTYLTAEEKNMKKKKKDGGRGRGRNSR